MEKPDNDLFADGAEARRLTSVDLAAALDQFSDAGLLAAGKINLIALDAIVERLGVRWTIRGAQIQDYVDRFIGRRLGSDGYHLRVSDTDFLICQPEIGRFAGQAACLQILREVLIHFIGDATQADGCVHQVTKVSASEIEGKRLRASDVQQGEWMEREASAAARPRSTVDRWTPFVASDGRELKVACRLEPVIELKSFRQIGCRIGARVFATDADEALTDGMIRKLSRADIVRIDLAATAWGLETLRAAESTGVQPSLIMPLSFISLSSQRARMAIAGLLREARELVRRGVICEIRDIEGVPQGVMLNVVSLIRPYCLFVVARIGPEPPVAATLAQLKHCGLQALSVECPPGLTDAAFLRWLKTTVEATRRVVRSTLLYQLASLRQAALAAEIGATHASVSPGGRNDG